MRGPRLATLALAGLGLLSAACPGRAPRGVRVGVHSDPLSLDPHAYNEVLTISMLSNVYESLTGFSADLKVRPGLAESWENPDEKTWRFRLREGARFHDGRPVEAEDVAFSIERARTHPLSQLTSYLVQVESVRALGRRSVEVRTFRSCAVLLNKLAWVSVVPRDSPFPIVKPIGSGPFRLGAFEKGKRFLLLRVDGEGSDGIPIPTLEFIPVGDAKKRTGLLAAKQVDLVTDPDTEKLLEIGSSPGCRLAHRPSSVVDYLHFLTTDPVFRDRRVREAIHLALDRRLLVERNLRGLGQPASQLVAPGVFGYDPSLPVTARDLPRARELLREAGFPNGLDLTLLHRVGRRGDEIVRQLGEAGIRVKDVTEPYIDIQDKLKRQAVPFYWGGIVAITADASDILDSFVHSRDRGYGQTNVIGYRNPALDALIEKSGETLEPVARRAELQRGLRTVMDDLWLLPLYNPYDTYGVADDLVWEPRLDRRVLGREMRWK